MDWLLNIIAWVVGKLFGKPAGPSQEAQAAAQAAAAETNLGTEEKANAQVLAATAAGDAADRVAVTDPSSLRLPDPDSRD